MLDDFEGYFLNPEMKRYFEDYKLYTLQIECTQKCQQRCIYCYARETPEREMSCDFVKTILNDAADLEVRKIEWLGGDPLLHPNWEELMSIAKNDHRLINNIWSSGNQLKYPDVAEKAIELTANGGFISVHLDSVNSLIYSQLNRGAHQFFEDTLEGIQLLLDLGKHPSEILNCLTLTGLQAGTDFEQTVRYFHDNFTMMTTFVGYKPAIDKLELSITPEQIKNAVIVKNKVCFESEVPAIIQCVSKYYCGTTASVISGGHITPCSRIRESFGEITDIRTFKVLFEENKHILLTRLLKERANLPSNCQECKYNSICWGCRSNAWYYSGDVLAADPKCWRRQ